MMMRNHHVGEAIVVDKLQGKNIPVGVVTDRDLVDPSCQLSPRVISSISTLRYANGGSCQVEKRTHKHGIIWKRKISIFILGIAIHPK